MSRAGRTSSHGPGNRGAARALPGRLTRGPRGDTQEATVTTTTPRPSGGAGRAHTGRGEALRGRGAPENRASAPGLPRAATVCGGFPVPRPSEVNTPSAAGRDGPREPPQCSESRGSGPGPTPGRDDRKGRAGRRAPALTGLARSWRPFSAGARGVLRLPARRCHPGAPRRGGRDTGFPAPWRASPGRYFPI